MNKIRYYLVLIPAFLVGWCAFVHAGEITDMAGRKVQVPETIGSVYSVSPPATCMVYAVDQELVAGLNYPVRAEERPYMSERMKNQPVIGGWFGQGQTPNLETLMQVKPDIILVWQQQISATSQKIEETLKPLGFPVVFIRIDRLQDYPKAFDFMGKLLNREKRCAALAGYARETLNMLDALQAKVPDDQKISVYYAEGADGLRTDCSASIHAELIPLCGGRNVHVCDARDIFGMESISAEQVIGYNPQVILAREPAFFDLVYKDARWQNIRAVRDRRIYRIPRSPFDWFDRPPSFMRLLGARWLMNLLHPDLYPVNMVEETQKFYQLFLHTPLDRKAAGEMLGL